MLTILFVHGWGFDASLWHAVAARLDGFDLAFADRGYFGAPKPCAPDGPTLAVAHSFGAMHVLSHLPPRCAGMVAINAFDRFCAADDFPGTPSRVLNRMIARFQREPDATLDDFRHRCGSEAPHPAPDKDALLADLMALAQEDRRAEAAGCGFPILSLQGGQDPLMPAAMRGAVFAGAEKVMREEVAGAGHLLPLTHPDVCAAHIAAMAERVG